MDLKVILMKLLASAENKGCDICNHDDDCLCSGAGAEFCGKGIVAEHLIANGVTIQEWIPVSIPPKEHGKYLTLCENIDIAQIRLFEGDWDSIQKVTHWMPLPKRNLSTK